MGRPEFKKVILFDGFCVLCSSAVDFVINRDLSDQFRFVSLQSEAGSRLANLANISPSDPSSVVLIDGDQLFTKSSAVLRIVDELPGGSRFLHWLIWIPQPIRDLVYDFVARYRYRWFGKMESCKIPPPGVQGKFLC